MLALSDPEADAFFLIETKKRRLPVITDGSQGFLIEAESGRVAVVTPEADILFSEPRAAEFPLSPLEANVSSDNAPIPFARWRPNDKLSRAPPRLAEAERTFSASA